MDRNVIVRTYPFFVQLNRINIFSYNDLYVEYFDTVVLMLADILYIYIIIFVNQSKSEEASWLHVTRAIFSKLFFQNFQWEMFPRVRWLR